MLISSSVRPVSMPSFRFRYSACCNSFLRSPSRFTAATSAPQPSSFRLPAVPLSFRLRFWLFGFGLTSLSRHIPFASILLFSPRTLVYYHTFIRMSTTFLKFFPLFLFFPVDIPRLSTIDCFLKHFSLNDCISYRHKKTLEPFLIPGPNAI